MNLCCDPLKMVTGRARDTDRAGISVQTNMLTGKESLIVSMRKGKKSEEPEFFSATYAVLNYCPFCGKKVEHDE